MSAVLSGPSFAPHRFEFADESVDFLRESVVLWMKSNAIVQIPVRGGSTFVLDFAKVPAAGAGEPEDDPGFDGTTWMLSRIADLIVTLRQRP